MKTKLLFLLALCFFAVNVAWAQRVVKGQVISALDDEPLPGVAIVETGTTNGTVTDIDGNFSIKLNKGTTLTVSYVGYITQTVQAKGGDLMIRMEEDK